MKAKINLSDLQTAIARVNKAKNYQIEIENYSFKGNYLNFTIKSKSKIAGARVSHSGRNLAKASWHAHGFLFDELFTIYPDLVIYSAGTKVTINSNWVDKNIGSKYAPCYFSETSIL